MTALDDAPPQGDEIGDFSPVTRRFFAMGWRSWSGRRDSNPRPSAWEAAWGAGTGAPKLHHMIMENTCWGGRDRGHQPAAVSIPSPGEKAAVRSAAWAYSSPLKGGYSSVSRKTYAL